MVQIWVHDRGFHAVCRVPSARYSNDDKVEANPVSCKIASLRVYVRSQKRAAEAGGREVRRSDPPRPSELDFDQACQYGRSLVRCVVELPLMVSTRMYDPVNVCEMGPRAENN